MDLKSWRENPYKMQISLFKKSKKAMMNKALGMMIMVVIVIIAFVVIFYLVGNLSPTLKTAADNISGSGLPLASLFTSNGVLLMIFMIAVFLALMLLAFGMMKGKGKGY